MDTTALWVLFNLFIFILLALDLGVFHRREHVVSLREAIFWSVLWTVLALVFNASMLWWYNPAQLSDATHAVRKTLALEFFTGYLIERMLSFDNIFVFAMLFSYFGVAARHQHRLLFWGILGALVMRGGMIWLGVELISRFEWILYVFGAFLFWTGAKMLFHTAEKIEPEKNPVLKIARKFLPITPAYEGQKFFVRHEGIWKATPMFLVLLVVETTDVAFAVDSIPAIFAITKDPFIIYSSNVFAILGLRALYFLLAAILPYFHFLGTGLSLVLMFIGAKMLVEKWVHISTVWSLSVVGSLLLGSVVASLVFKSAEKRALPKTKATKGTSNEGKNA
jgi:tellurite resistance protein TerC